MNDDKTIIAQTGFVRHYHGGSRALTDPAEVRATHACYQGCIHNDADESVGFSDALVGVLRKLPEGTPVEIVVHVKGDPDKRFFDDPWVLLKAHRYGPLSKRIEQGGFDDAD